MICTIQCYVTMTDFESCGPIVMALLTNCQLQVRQESWRGFNEAETSSQCRFICFSASQFTTHMSERWECSIWLVCCHGNGSLKYSIVRDWKWLNGRYDRRLVHLWGWSFKMSMYLRCLGIGVPLTSKMALKSTKSWKGTSLLWLVWISSIMQSGTYIALGPGWLTCCFGQPLSGTHLQVVICHWTILGSSQWWLQSTVTFKTWQTIILTRRFVDLGCNTCSKMTS